MKTKLATLLLLTAVITPSHAYEPPASSAACLACHSIDAKKIGPSFQDVAAKYADDKDHIVSAIKNGSNGVWGSVPMVPNQVSDEDADALADWILSTAN